jgi:hypothetical protein
MAQDVTASVDLSGLTPDTNIDSSDVSVPITNLVTILNAVLNGTQAFDRQKRQAPTIKTLASDVLTVDLDNHFVAAQTGTTDDLQQILGGVQGQTLFLQADTGDTITVKHGLSNIKLNSSSDVVLSGTTVLMLYYDGTDWADTSIPALTPITSPPINLLMNGSFEVWENGTTTAPDNWVTTGAGATILKETSIIKHGAAALRLTRVGTDCHVSRNVWPACQRWRNDDVQQLSRRLISMGVPDRDRDRRGKCYRAERRVTGGYRQHGCLYRWGCTGRRFSGFTVNACSTACQ